ncbi:MAG: TIGR01244 family sulfur transferase [Zymomonas mobilis]|uniref:Uncharacterized protein (TIGR01244 family) n=1 Tax=Zymomonas mobilis TaxID=542 RepID=A0A542W2V8_ZYMMB|nr:TIGR01244 family sulfur transferase [Zymomonas mobilis]TQL17910.1 uncharacterized protein (TIGR01244 family) [Zymomonas mobilis]
MNRFKRLNNDIAVSPQLLVEDIKEAALQGFGHIINNRPDGEGSNQPSGSVIEAAAKAEGLGYTAIPVRPGGIDENAIVAMADILKKADKPILAYCFSGTRSAFLWALASAAIGEADADVIFAEAANAGYDLSPIMPLVDSLSASAQSK